MNQTLFDKIYNRIWETPDFPQTKIAHLLETMPPYSRDLPSLFYILPWGEEIKEETESNASALMAMTLSLFIHDDTDKNRAFNMKESVLNGDFLFALAFSSLPATTKNDVAVSFVKTYRQFNEGRLNHKSRKKEELSDKTVLTFARDDYGLLLREIARSAAKEAEKPEKEQAAYAEIAEDIGTLWGLHLEGYDIDTAYLIERATKKINALSWTSNLTNLLQTMKQTW